jgi:TPR repeat protein
MRIYEKGVASKILAGIVAFFLPAGMSGNEAALAAGSAMIQGGGNGSVETLKFSSVDEAFRQGMGSLRLRRLEFALPALEYAAQNQMPLAQLMLARIYSQILKKPNHVKAFYYYGLVADQLAEARSYHPDARLGAEAFVARAQYYERGLKEIKLEPNSEEAARLYTHAVYQFRDTIAQYHLGSLYLEGRGVKRNISIARHWLLIAAMKNHAPSQAAWAKYLWQSKSARYHAKALAYIELARRNADPESREYKKIAALYEEINAKVGPEAKQMASILVMRWKQRFGIKNSIRANPALVANETPEIKHPPRPPVYGSTHAMPNVFQTVGDRKDNQFDLRPAIEQNK